MKYRVVIFAIVFLAIFAEEFIRPAGAIVTAAAPKAELGPRYCGAYALATALKSLDLPADRQVLTSAKYVSEADGSTADDLCRGATDFGASATVLSGVGAASLRAADSPVLLHVRQPGHANNYTHWILFLGCDGDLARVADPPRGVETAPLAELLALSDGVGVRIDRVGRASAIFRAAAWLDMAKAVLLAAVAVVSLGNRRRSRGAAIDVLILLVISAGIALVWNTCREEGLLRNPTGLRLVSCRYSAATIPECTRERLTEAHVTIVDTRLERDYRSEHIAGAVSIPITTSWLERRRLLADLPRDQLIIMYCMSDKCLWSDEIAAEAVAYGFRNVHIYRGGYRDWINHGTKQ